jgi:hypothetical protein
MARREQDPYEYLTGDEMETVVSGRGKVTPNVRRARAFDRVETANMRASQRNKKLLMKLAFKITKPETKAEIHFMSEKPDWKAFEKNLRNGKFREAVLKAEQSDPVLKRYVKNFGGYKASKDEVARITSKDSGKTYVVKDLHTGRLGCNCGDWQYKHSAHGGDCKHIKSVKQSKMVKLGGAVPLSVLGTGMSIAHRTETNRVKGVRAKQALKELGYRPRSPFGI